MEGMDEREAVREANDRFYRCLEGLDLTAMDGLWLHEGWVRCIHPGWDVLVGWEAVRQSWATIFASTQWLRVVATDVDIADFGEIALVACSENLTAADGADVGVAVSQATNIFRKTPEGWRMIHHHSSTTPVRVTQPFSGHVQ
jgi:ketosteroid isomerase-like protein